MDIKLFVSTFAMIFLAELGDKTQLAVMSQAGSHSGKWTIFAAGALALVLTTALGVLAGDLLRRYIPDERYVKVGAGLLFLVFGVLMVREGLCAEKPPEWDDTVDKSWCAGYELVEIPSSVDGSLQRAYFHKSPNPGRPLVVSLHTWSADYAQHDRLAGPAVELDYNFIHPDFRGPNRTPDAMCSPKAVLDIQDALLYALRESKADPAEVHIIGASGGAYATLMCYMAMEFTAKSYHAWAPISDIGAWYWESRGRKQRYADDIAKSLGGAFDAAEAARRSPLLLPLPREKRRNARLCIYEGVHDGYAGSVPITHALHMYNRVAGEFKYGTSDRAELAQKALSDPELVSEAEMLNLVVRRCDPASDPDRRLLGQRIHLERNCGNIRLVIFEGGHQQLDGALNLLQPGATTAK